MTAVQESKSRDGFYSKFRLVKFIVAISCCQLLLFIRCTSPTEEAFSGIEKTILLDSQPMLFLGQNTDSLAVLYNISGCLEHCDEPFEYWTCSATGRNKGSADSVVNSFFYTAVKHKTEKTAKLVSYSLISYNNDQTSKQFDLLKQKINSSNDVIDSIYTEKFTQRKIVTYFYLNYKISFIKHSNNREELRVSLRSTNSLFKAECLKNYEKEYWLDELW